MRKRVIRAGEIEIEDSEGRVRARLGVTNDDFPFVAFYGTDERLRARFGVQPVNEVDVNATPLRGMLQ